MFSYITVAPEITVSDQLHGVGPGANVTIKCKVEAHPSAINYWMKDQAEMLLDGPKYQINEEIINDYERIMRLTIKNWQKIDESHFTCISTNSLGKADGKIQAYSKFEILSSLYGVVSSLFISLALRSSGHRRRVD